MSTSAERLQQFFESFAREREHALTRLPELFTEDVHFRDPFRDTHGIDAFRTLFERMFAQYKRVHFTDFACEGDEQGFTLTYAMHLRMLVPPTFVTHMASVCRVRDGRICSLRDFYDFPSALASPLPLLGAAYRRVVNALFL